MLAPSERNRTLALGVLALAVMAALVLAAVVPLVATTAGRAAGQSATFDAYIWRVTRFTLIQAGLSTLFSVALAIPLSSAIARRRDFFGRAWLIRLLALPLGLPQIVAALGLVEIWGRNGLLNGLLGRAGLAEPVSIYGLGGILLAHVFFNLPLAARLMVLELERLPGEYWAIAGQLGMNRRAVFRFVEWPALARVVPGIAGLVFMLCATSFTVVLLLGGGPAATTIEVAIYQALRFDFDPPRAVMLALLQIALTSLVLLALRLAGGTAEEGATAGRTVRRYDRDSPLARTCDAITHRLGRGISRSTPPGDRRLRRRRGPSEAPVGTRRLAGGRHQPGHRPGGRSRRPPARPGAGGCPLCRPAACTAPPRRPAARAPRRVLPPPSSSWSRRSCLARAGSCSCTTGSTSSPWRRRSSSSSTP